MLKKISLLAMTGLYVIAGIVHFISPSAYLKWMPDYIPLHRFMIALSGACEIAFGLLLLPERTRKAAAWLIIAMLLVFLTVHMNMLRYAIANNSSWLIWAILRLPLQFFLVWWAWLFTRQKAPSSE